MLAAAVIAITLALALYTAGVWWEHRDRLLRPVHAVLFLAGLTCDATGTALMSSIAGGTRQAEPASLLPALHGVTGTLAIALMAFHAMWAIIALVRSRDAEKAVFHRFSIAVWAVWLVPYLLGMAMGMAG